NNGNGIFGQPLFVSDPAVNFAPPFGPTLVAGNFSGDGLTDLAFATPNPGLVTILRSNGDDTFQQEPSFTVGAGPASLVVGNFSNSGHLDIATLNYYSNDITTLLGNGDGTFAQLPHNTTGFAPFAPVYADFNNDGHLDIA